MIFSASIKKNIFDRFCLIKLLFFPLLISCSSNQNNVIEIISPPRFPKDLASIPEQTENPELISLISVAEKIKDVSIGRKDPFLPPDVEGDKLFVPSEFEYHGQISSSGIVNAFVSYKDRSGVIKLGDIGGENTDLLPNGWKILSLDTDTKVLTLGFEDRSVNVDLFPD